MGMCGSKNALVFDVKDCALVAIATGYKARNLSELRDCIAIIPEGSLYYHIWCGRMRPHFESQRYSNDLSMWVDQWLHDPILSERLDVIDPTVFSNYQAIREDLLDIIDIRLDEVELVPSSTRKDSFYFVRSNIVIFGTRYEASKPENLVHIIPHLSHSSIFYHFIDARRRTEDSHDDFSNWIKGFGAEYDDLVHQIYNIDPYFIALGELQGKLQKIFTNYFQEKEG